MFHISSERACLSAERSPLQVYNDSPLPMPPTPSPLGPYCTRFRSMATNRPSILRESISLPPPSYRLSMPPRRVCLCVYARDVVFLRYINTQSDGCINTVGGERCRLFSIYNFAEPVLQSASLRMEWDRGYLIPRCFYRESHSLDGLDVHKLRRPRDPRAKYPAGIRLVVSRGGGGGEHRFLEHWNVRPSPPPTPRLSRLEQRVTTTRRGSVGNGYRYRSGRG